MPPKKNNTVVLMDYLEQKKATRSIVIDLGGEHGTVTVPPSELWSDDVWDTAHKGDTRDAVELLLGKEASDKFHAAGGNWRVLNGVVAQQNGISAGESGASSGS